MVTFLDLTLTLTLTLTSTLTLTNLQPWYPTNRYDTECCSSTLSMQAYDALDKLGHGYRYHFNCDVTVTLFYKGLKPNFNTISTYIQVCVYQVSCFYSFGLLTYREEENGGNNMPPAPQRLASGAEARRPPC